VAWAGKLKCNIQGNINLHMKKPGKTFGDRIKGTLKNAFGKRKAPQTEAEAMGEDSVTDFPAQAGPSGNVHSETPSLANTDGQDLQGNVAAEHTSHRPASESDESDSSSTSSLGVLLTRLPEVGKDPVPDNSGAAAAGPGRRKVITGLKAEPPAAEPKPTGDLKLTKLKFETKFHICSDGTPAEGSLKLRELTYEDYYVLMDGDYYHWLRKRTHAKDVKKPVFLPFTIDSSMKLKCRATFEVSADKTLSSTPKIRITSSNNFEFNMQDGGTSGKFELDFEVTEASEAAYRNKISYYPELILSFDYSIDGGKTWEHSGESLNEMYITWKRPSAKLFSIEYDVGIKMRFKFGQTPGKLYIPESLFFIGCHNAIGVGNESADESQNKLNVMNAIFTDFANLKVRRRYEKFSHEQHMGYWRGHFNAVGDLGKEYGLGYLLQFGEGRCSHWTLLLLSIAYLHGIDKVQEYAIGTVMSTHKKGPLENDSNGRFIRIKINDKESDEIKAPENVNDMIYKVGPAEKLVDGMKVLKTNGTEYRIVTYNMLIPCIFLVKAWAIEDPNPPVTTDPVPAQGNASPLNFFWNHVFVMFGTRNSDMRYFDPSYGSKSVQAFPTDITFKHAYSIAALDGVVLAAMTAESKNDLSRKMYDGINSDSYADLYTPYLFNRDHSAVDGYYYQTINVNMEEHLITL